MQHFSIQNIHKQQQSIVCCKNTAHFSSENCPTIIIKIGAKNTVVIKPITKCYGAKLKSLILIQYINKKISVTYKLLIITYNLLIKLLIIIKLIIQNLASGSLFGDRVWLRLAILMLSVVEFILARYAVGWVVLTFL